ncbi:MAG: DUF1353 domain-containing protein [Acidimicrobiales bacterium]
MPVEQPAPWSESFRIEADDAIQDRGDIRLDQIANKTFVLGSTITYLGAKTGLEGKGLSDEVLEDIRSVTPDHLAPDTDLASVPGPLRWFLNSYGIHTPAALIHDRLIPTLTDATPGMTDAYADRYFRFMLEDLGVPWLRRWLMWAAVAFRTFYVTKRSRTILWVLISLISIATFVFAVATGNYWLALGLIFVPIPVAGLWRGQYGAGILAAVCAPFIAPPVVMAAVGYGVYWVLEKIAGVVFPGRSVTPQRDLRRSPDRTEAMLDA